MLSADPPLVGFVVWPRRSGGAKATLRHVRATREFALSALSHRLLAQARRAGLVPKRRLAPARPGLVLEPGRRVRAPLVAGAPVQIECRLVELLRPRRSRGVLVVGEVLFARLDPGLRRRGAGRRGGGLPVAHVATLASGEYLFGSVGRMLRVRE